MMETTIGINMLSIWPVLLTPIRSHIIVLRTTANANAPLTALSA